MLAHKTYHLPALVFDASVGASSQKYPDHLTVSSVVERNPANDKRRTPTEYDGTHCRFDGVKTSAMKNKDYGDMLGVRLASVLVPGQVQGSSVLLFAATISPSSGVLRIDVCSPV